MVDEPRNEEGVQNESTPSSDAAITEDTKQPDKESAPAENVNYQEELEKERARAERLKQQLAGREKQVEELQTSVLARRFFEEPEEEKAPAPQEKQEGQQKKQVNSADRVRDEMLIKATLKDIKDDMQSRYGADKHVPFDSQEVQRRILEADPQGTSLLNPQIWEYMYKVIRGEKLDEITSKYESEKKAIVDKEDSKMVDSPSVPTNTGNNDGDRLPFEKAIHVLSTDELKTKYPAEYNSMLMKSLGL